MRQGRHSHTADHPWDWTVNADGDIATGRRSACQPPAERISFGLSRRASYEPQALRELLKPILDELQDTLERFEGQPTPADHRWLRGQLRRLADRLDPRTG
jgi:hypothetical protein